MVDSSQAYDHHSENEKIRAKDSFIEMYTAPGKFIKKPSDPVEHPDHYNQGGFELADVIEAFNLTYHLGSVAKYVFRCQYKNNKLEDLRKASWHLKREIQIEEHKNA